MNTSMKSKLQAQAPFAKTERVEGMALVLALLFATLAVVSVSVLSGRLLSQKDQTDFYTEHAVDFLGIDAALADSHASLMSGGTGQIGYNGDFDFELNENNQMVLPDFTDENVEPLHMGTTPEVEYFAVVDRWGDDGIDNNDNGQIDDTTEMGLFTVYAFARNNGITRRVEVVYAGDDVNVWQNAIFADQGSTPGNIGGNSNIHGSVHILGNNVPDNGEVFAFSGTGNLYNNYERSGGPGLSDYLKERVPPLPTRTVNGEPNQETLNAILRVRNGIVSMDGNSEIGAQEDDNGAKDTMDGTYVTDGWNGNKARDGVPEHVYSDNGWDEPYDLGDTVEFPTFDSEWRWPDGAQCYEYGGSYNETPGSTELSPGGTEYSHIDFFRNVLAGNKVYNGNVTITAGTSYYLNLTRGGANPNDRVQPNPASCVKGDTYIYYNKNTNVMEINGQILINGNLSINRSGGKKVLNYSGRAAMLVTGDVTLNTSLLTCNNSDPNDYERSFPEKNCLGVMAGRDMVLGDTSQLDVLGAFYAQGNVRFNRQTVIMGSLVTSTFNMNSQVPAIFQVPSLRWNLPLGMIGNYPVSSMAAISWRELPTVED